MVVNEDQLAEEGQYTGCVPQYGIEVLLGINYTVWKVMFWFSWFLHQFRKIEPVWILVTMLISLDKFCGWSRISKRGCANPKEGCTNLLFGKSLPKTRWKWKKFDRGGERVSLGFLFAIQNSKTRILIDFLKFHWMSSFCEQRLDEADAVRVDVRFTTSPIDGRSVRLGAVRRRRSTGNNAPLLNFLFFCFLFRLIHIERQYWHLDGFHGFTIVIFGGSLESP